MERLRWNPRKSTTPVYTIRNKKTRHYLSMSSEDVVVMKEKSSEEPASWWSMQLGDVDENGDVVYTIVNSKYNVTLSKGSTFDAHVHAEAGGSDKFVIAPYKKKVGSWHRKKALKRQWEMVRDTPLLRPGGTFLSTMTWADACPDCGDWYQMERNRLNEIGRLQEDARSVVRKSGVRGFCDWNVHQIVVFLKNHQLLTAMQQEGRYACINYQLDDYAKLLKEVVLSECFTECTEALKVGFSDYDCAKEPVAQVDLEKHALRLENAFTASPQCTELPLDTVGDLTELAVKQVCWKWSPPNALWTRTDKDVKSLLASEGAGVCSLRSWDVKKSRNPKDIIQNGTCPEGSMCDCPETWLVKQPTAANIRNDDMRKYFFGAGAIQPEVFFTRMRKFFVGALQQQLARLNIMGLLLQGSLHTTSLFKVWMVITNENFLWAAGWVGVRGNIKNDKTKWRCADSVACWPAEPEREDGGVCRLGKEAAKGGSPLWFVPEAGLKFERKMFGCDLEACSNEEMLHQVVGIDKEDGKTFYNCQPLNYEEMTNSQRQQFVDALSASGVENEYDLSVARSWFQ